MTGSVIIRHGHTIDDAGRILHDERPATWQEAEKIAGRRLDRRKAYAIIDGAIHESIRWTTSCSGCSYGVNDRGGGCRECGFHGVVRQGYWLPLALTDLGP